jgi:hypothetical protein
MPMFFADSQRVRRGNFYGGCTYSIITCCRVFPHGGYRPRTAALKILKRFPGESAQAFSRASDRITALTHGHTYEVLSLESSYTRHACSLQNNGESLNASPTSKKRKDFFILNRNDCIIKRHSHAFQAHLESLDPTRSIYSIYTGKLGANLNSIDPKFDAVPGSGPPGTSWELAGSA